MINLVSASTTIMLQAADTENLEDTYVSEASQGSNYGSETYLAIARRTIAGVDRQSFITFNLSSISENDIITSANLSLYLYSKFLTYETSIYNTTSFSESTLNWTNKPSLDILQDNTTNPSQGSWQYWNVTNVVISSQGSDNVSFVIIPDKMSLGLLNYYYSKEYATLGLRPYLNITYTEPPPVIYSKHFIFREDKHLTFRGLLRLIFKI